MSGVMDMLQSFQMSHTYKLFVESVAIPDLAYRRPYAVASERSEEATYRA